MQQDADNQVRIVKEYSVPKPTREPTKNDKLRHADGDLAYLRAEFKRTKSRCTRLENEIKSVIAMLTAALKGEQETYDQVKRRISRLKGSLEYPGHD